MEVTNYSRVIEALSCICSANSDMRSVVMDINSGELVSFYNLDSTGEAFRQATAITASFFGKLWAGQDETANQHDDKLEILFNVNESGVNSLTPFYSRSATDSKRDGLLLVIMAGEIELGALKRISEQGVEKLSRLFFDDGKKK